jgi:FkbM family methyltransferase
MKTIHKIALAKLAYAVVHNARRVVGLGDRCVVERKGLRFDLDLSQGIDLTIFLQGTFERSTAKALARHIVPGAIVVDVGANIGAHTLPMASHVGEAGRVIAFEPTDFAFGRLKRNLALNPALEKRVTAYQSFLGPEDASDIPPAIYSGWPLNYVEDLHPKHKGKLNPTQKAVSRSLDSVLAEHGNPTVQLVKLDVDGFECDVLAGAQDVMRRCRPLFLLELAPYVLAERDASLRQLLSFFEPLGYRFYHEKTERALPHDEKSLSDWIADGESKNVIARAQ